MYRRENGGRMAIPSLPLESEGDPQVCAAHDHCANSNAFLWAPVSKESLKMASLPLGLKARQLGCQRHVGDSCLRAFRLEKRDMFDVVCGDDHSSEALHP